MPAVVTSRQLSKRYRLGTGAGAGSDHTLGEMVYDRLASLLRRNRDQCARREPFWALRDVNFEVSRGEVLGVIGRNGAGKSTLLKVLASITRPTSGEVEMRGRVGSLLEVGTGFHPELSGRENIYLSAAVLGMSRREVKRKFAEIVEFSGVEKFLDTPVKRYSSGMYVRLAFGVAAHLEPEILLIDEVLAVGDAGFQQRCLDKMDGIAKGGRTVVFVSHDMGAVQRLCDTVMVLHHGKVDTITDPTAAVTRYLQLASDWRDQPQRAFAGPLRDRLIVHDLRLSEVKSDGSVATDTSYDERDRSLIHPARPIRIEVDAEALHPIPNLRMLAAVYQRGVRVVSTTDGDAAEVPAGRFRCELELPANFLRPGPYTLGVGARREGSNEYLWGADVHRFEVIENWSGDYQAINEGLVNVPTQGRRVLLPEAATAMQEAA